MSWLATDGKWTIQCTQFSILTLFTFFSLYLSMMMPLMASTSSMRLKVIFFCCKETPPSCLPVLGTSSPRKEAPRLVPYCPPRTGSK